jgi:hypothetical protein
MPRGAEARAWWADVEDVKERIEHRRASERLAAAPVPSAELDSAALGQSSQDRLQAAGFTDDWFEERRTVSITGQPASGMGAARLRLVESAPSVAEAAVATRHRDRPRMNVLERLGSHPDRVAGLAVMLGFLLVLAAMLSTNS